MCAYIAKGQRTFNNCTIQAHCSTLTSTEVLGVRLVVIELHEVINLLRTRSLVEVYGVAHSARHLHGGVLVRVVLVWVFGLYGQGRALLELHVACVLKNMY